MENKSLYKNAFYKVILNVFNILVPVLIGPYALNKLGTWGMATMDFSQVIFSFFLIFAGFGIYTYGVREVSRIRDDKVKLKEFFGSLFFLGVITNIVTLIVYLIYITVIYKTHDAFPVMLVLSLNFLCNIFYVEWVNEAVENYDFITKKTIFVRLVYLVLLFLFIKSPEDYIKFAIINVVWTTLNNLISFSYIKKHVGISFKKVNIKRHIKSLLLVILLSNISVLFTSLDAFMLGEIVGIETTTYYKTAQNITNMINTVLLSIVFVSLPRLSHVLGQENKKGYIELLDKITENFFAFLFPAAIGIFCLSHEIIMIYGGDKIIPSINVLKVFSMYMVLWGVEYILTQQVIYVNRKERALPYMIAIAGGLNLSLNIILVKSGIFNPITAISTTLISEGVLIFIEYIYIRKILKIEFNIITFDKLKYLLVSLLFIPITYIVKTFITKNIFLSSFIIMILCGLVYFSIFYITKDKVLLNLLNVIKNKRKN